MAYRRMSICKSCKVYNDGVCDSTKYHIAIKDFRYNGELRFQGRVYTGCGCPLKAKTNSVKSQCPLGKW